MKLVLVSLDHPCTAEEVKVRCASELLCASERPVLIDDGCRTKTTGDCDCDSEEEDNDEEDDEEDDVEEDVDDEEPV